MPTCPPQKRTFNVAGFKIERGGNILNVDTGASLMSSVSGFAAYIQCYEGGNSVMAIKKDGQTILINKSIKSIINKLFKESGINLQFLKKNSKEYIGGTNLIPIPLGLGTVLIPVKVRKTIGINDGSFAYVDISTIKEISEDKNAIIRLKCGSIINCPETVKTIKNRMKTAKFIEEKFA
jgi:bifunctional DNA-binding transcriptional regulator/antitoxin component of YhaV-PrlF toxin-antitoxin module